MNPNMSEEEAVELMREHVVGQWVEKPKNLSDKTITYKITGARVHNGVPQLERTPLLESSEGFKLRPINSTWFTLAEFNHEVNSDDGDWTITEDPR